MAATTDPAQLIRDLIAESDGSIGALREAARTSQDPAVLVAAALTTPARAELLARAAAVATRTRDRQLVAVAAAHLLGEHDRTLLLARDHLAAHPDSLLVAHIAALSTHR
jgi:molybdopterin-guanine dinucleotide biosynthesis protein A